MLASRPGASEPAWPNTDEPRRHHARLPAQRCGGIVSRVWAWCCSPSHSAASVRVQTTPSVDARYREPRIPAGSVNAFGGSGSAVGQGLTARSSAAARRLPDSTREAASRPPVVRSRDTARSAEGCSHIVAVAAGPETKKRRRRADSNRRSEFCRLLPCHLATAPHGAIRGEYTRIRRPHAALAAPRQATRTARARAGEQRGRAHHAPARRAASASAPRRAAPCLLPEGAAGGNRDAASRPPQPTAAASLSPAPTRSNCFTSPCPGPRQPLRPHVAQHAAAASSLLGPRQQRRLTRPALRAARTHAPVLHAAPPGPAQATRPCSRRMRAKRAAPSPRTLLEHAWLTPEPSAYRDPKCTGSCPAPTASPEKSCKRASEASETRGWRVMFRIRKPKTLLTLVTVRCVRNASEARQQGVRNRGRVRRVGRAAARPAVWQAWQRSAGGLARVGCGAVHQQAGGTAGHSRCVSGESGLDGTAAGCGGKP